MQVRVGPVPAASASWWTAYARDVLQQVVTAPGSLAEVDDSMLVAFSELLDEWEGVARRARSDPFVWDMELSDDLVLVLAEAFHGLVLGLAAAAEARGYTLAPPEGEAFYHALVDGLLAALVEAGGDAGARGAELRASWPGLN